MEAGWEQHLRGMLQYAATPTCRRALLARWALPRCSTVLPLVPLHHYCNCVVGTPIGFDHSAALLYWNACRHFGEPPPLCDAMCDCCKAGAAAGGGATGAAAGGAAAAATAAGGEGGGVVLKDVTEATKGAVQTLQVRWERRVALRRLGRSVSFAVALRRWIWLRLFAPACLLHALP